MNVQKLTLSAITFYQGLESTKRTILYSVFGYQSDCKHSPTCSDYAMSEIKKNGTIAGLWRGFWQIATCW